MNITIERIDIPDNKTNEITSPKVFKPRKIKDKDGKFLYHEDGIFSRRIFGQYGHCDCKDEFDNYTNHKIGICKKCGVRIIRKSKTPDWYINLQLIRVPFLTIDYKEFGKNRHIIQGLMEYRGILYDGKYLEVDLQNMNLEDFNMSLVKYGKKALMSLGVSEDWYNKNTTNKIYVPHPSARKITTVGDKHYLGPLNNALIDILKQKEKLIKAQSISIDVFTDLAIRRALFTSVETVYDELFKMMAGQKKTSIIDREVKGQNLTGAVRGVLTNNFGLSEDTVVLGKYFIKSLYPELYDKYTKTRKIGQNEYYIPDSTNIFALNEELRNKGYYILVNRPPTIGEKSIMAFRPRFSDLDEEKYVIQMNPISFDGFAADTDGDCVLCIALYTTEANKEAEKLLPSNNYIGGANGEIRNKLPEDFEYVMEKAYGDGVGEQISRLINNTKEEE